MVYVRRGLLRGVGRGRVMKTYSKIALIVVFATLVVFVGLATRPPADSMSFQADDDTEWTTLNQAGTWVDGEAEAPPALVIWADPQNCEEHRSKFTAGYSFCVTGPDDCEYTRQCVFCPEVCSEALALAEGE